ncbi:MAG: orotidine-5'-phosphate decarboxylase [Eubacteriales bacterium]
MSFDILQNKILSLDKPNPTVFGLDARIEYVPAHIREESYKVYGKTLQGAVEAIYQFNMELMDNLTDLIPAVKFQSAYFENFGWEGMEVLRNLIEYGKNKGYFVITDVKRGDVPSTAEAYSEAWLGETKVTADEDVEEDETPESFAAFNSTCITLNPYMGMDTLEPFLETCKTHDRTAFILVRTSNPGAAAIQDIITDNGLPLYSVIGKMVEDMSKGTEGEHGYTRFGAVVGATNPEQLQKLRKELPNTFFLVPGYGAQGGSAEDVQHAFHAGGQGAVVNSSRGLMCAWQKTGHNGEDFVEATRSAATQMRANIAKFINIIG